MATMKVSGIDMFVKQFEKLAQEARSINRGALGEAAGYVADQIMNALEGMPTHDDDYTVIRRSGATESEKEQIIANFGISKFKESGGSTDTSVGFHGYVHTKSKKFNDNVPTGMLVQAINYGTDFRQGTHTVDRAIKSAKDNAIKKMESYIDKEVNKIMK